MILQNISSVDPMSGGTLKHEWVKHTIQGSTDSSCITQGNGSANRIHCLSVNSNKGLVAILLQTFQAVNSG